MNADTTQQSMLQFFGQAATVALLGVVLTVATFHTHHGWNWSEFSQDGVATAHHIEADSNYCPVCANLFETEAGTSLRLASILPQAIVVVPFHAEPFCSPVTNRNSGRAPPFYLV